MTSSKPIPQKQKDADAATKRRNLLLIIGAVVLLIGIISVVLRHQPNTNLSTAQLHTVDRLHSIVAYSGGDWSKVKPEDKQFFIAGPGSGNAGSAQMVFGSMAAQMKQK
jgi:hypothetical protein